MPRTKGISDETLLGGCRATFLSEGLGVSTRCLAQSVGVSEGLLFQRFHSKDELFVACMRLPVAAMDEVLERALQRKSIHTGLALLGGAALTYLRAQMPVLLLVLAHPKHRDGTWSTKDGHGLLGDARTLQQPFATLLATHADTQSMNPRHRAATVALLVSALLTRALHEQLRVEDPANDGPWLRQTIAALGQGFTAR